MICSQQCLGPGKVLNLLFCLVLAACQESAHDTSGDGGGNDPVVSSGAQPVGAASGGVVPLPSPVTAETVTTTTVEDPGFALRRVTPEQLSNTLYKALGYRLGKLNAFGRFNDKIQSVYGISLGGVDFDIASIRDESIQAQTLLIAHSLAWQASASVVTSETALATGARLVFTKCTLEVDRPYMSEDAATTAAQQAATLAGEVRWKDQIRELYLRLFAREPTTDEMQALSDAFVTILRNEGLSTLSGWKGVLYGLLSSSELWTL